MILHADPLKSLFSITSSWGPGSHHPILAQVGALDDSYWGGDNI